MSLINSLEIIEIHQVTGKPMTIRTILKDVLKVTEFCKVHSNNVVFYTGVPILGLYPTLVSVLNTDFQHQILNMSSVTVVSMPFKEYFNCNILIFCVLFCRLDAANDESLNLNDSDLLEAELLELLGGSEEIKKTENSALDQYDEDDDLLLEELLS